MLRTADRFIGVIMQDVQGVSRSALGGLTPRYREIWEAVLERRRQWVSELEDFKQLIEQNTAEPAEPPPSPSRVRAKSPL